MPAPLPEGKHRKIVSMRLNPSQLEKIDELYARHKFKSKTAFYEFMLSFAICALESDTIGAMRLMQDVALQQMDGMPENTKDMFQDKILELFGVASVEVSKANQRVRKKIS